MRIQFASIDRSWRRNWYRLNVFANYPPDTFKVIHKINFIKFVNISRREFTETGSFFAVDDVVLIGVTHCGL